MSARDDINALSNVTSTQLDWNAKQMEWNAEHSRRLTIVQDLVAPLARRVARLELVVFIQSIALLVLSVSWLIWAVTP